MPVRSAASAGTAGPVGHVEVGGSLLVVVAGIVVAAVVAGAAVVVLGLVEVVVAGPVAVVVDESVVVEGEFASPEQAVRAKQTTRPAPTADRHIPSDYAPSRPNRTNRSLDHGHLDRLAG